MSWRTAHKRSVPCTKESQSGTGLRMRHVIEECLATGRKFKTVPGLGNLLEGRVTVDQLREVNLEELLGRDPVRLDQDAMCRELADQVVLVTGAAGSIGQELCYQIQECGPAKLICLDQAETPMFYLQRKLTRSKCGDRVIYSVADVTEREGVTNILRAHGVQIIFNAAAYKHVPMMECNVAEAVRNNIFGLIKLLLAAEEAGCERFLLISSDKAVNPSSVMGATKRVGELILPLALRRCGALPSDLAMCLAPRPVLCRWFSSNSTAKGVLP